MATVNGRANATRNTRIACARASQRIAPSKSSSRGKRISQVSHEHSQKGLEKLNSTWIGLAVTVMINVVSVSYMTGTVLTRLTHVEQATAAQGSQLKETVKLETKLAVLERELSSINATLSRLERHITGSRN